MMSESQVLREDRLYLLRVAASAPQAEALAAWTAWIERSPRPLDQTLETRFSPYIYRRLRSWGQADCNLPYLTRAHETAWSRNQMLFAAALPVLQEYIRQGLTPIILKGGAMLVHYANDFGHRSMSDIDILVPRHSLTVAEAVLDQLGWVPTEPRRSADLRFSHARSYRNANGGSIDLHWHITFYWRSSLLDSELCAHAVACEYSGLALAVLSPTAQLFHSCLHGAFKRKQNEYWIVDAMEILRTRADEIDWGELLELTRRARGCVRMRRSLEVLRAADGVVIPSEILEQLSTERRSFPEQLEHFHEGSGTTGVFGALPGFIADYLRTSPESQSVIGFVPGFFAFLRYHWKLPTNSAVLKRIGSTGVRLLTSRFQSGAPGTE